MAEITNTTHETLITGTSEADSIKNYGGKVTINTGNGDDYVDNFFWSSTYGNSSANYVSINTGAGNDEVYNHHGRYSTINTGEGNDSVYNYNEGYYCTINTGKGNDYVCNNHYGHDCTINTGEGNDSYYGYNASSCTINTGEGNDLISLSSKKYGDYDDSKYNVIIYNSGDGNDTIYGFDGDEILSISGGSYSTAQSGDDVIVTVDDGEISLVGAVNYFSDKNIVFKQTVEENKWTLNGTTAKYGISGNTLITVSGVKSLDGISLSNDVVTITESALNKSNITISDGYKLALQGVAAPKYTNAHFDGTTYKSSSNTEGYTLADNKITYTAAISETDLFTISGVKSTSGITISGKTVTVPNSALNQEKVTITGGYSLALADDVTKTSTTAAGWNMSGNTAVYKNSAISAGYKLENNQISYVAASGGEKITVSGVKSLDGLSISGKTVTVTANSLNKSDVTISNGYTLALQGVAAPKYTNAHFDGTTYKSSSNTEGYTLADNKITYTAAITETDLFTISGVKSTSGIMISGNKVTVPNSALNQGTVTITGGYILSLADDVTKTSTTADGWSFNGNTAVYKNSGVVAGYKLANNQISYVSASGGEILIKIDGVKSADGISLSGNTITVGAAALNNSNVTVSNGYILSLATDAPTPQTTAAHWELNGSTATYKNTLTSASYSIVNNQIVYNAASGGETLITVEGVKSLKGLTLSGSTVKVAASALNKNTVTVSNGYILSLANDATTPQTTPAHWEINGTTATYKNTATSAGYSVINNQIVYNTENGGENLITVSGVKSLDSISLIGNTIMVGAAALNQNNVTVSNGYTLSLKNDVTTPQTATAHWEINGTTATYKSSSTSAGYSVVNNQIIYNVASGGENLITINGVKSLDGIYLNGNTITVSNSSLNQENVTISNGYNLIPDYDVTISKNTAAHWELNGTTATYKNDLTTVGYQLSNNQLIYKPNSGGETLVTVNGVKSIDGLTLTGNTIMISAASLNKKNVTVSNNNYNLTLAGDVKLPETTEAHWELKGTTATYKNVSTTAGYKLNAKNQIIYNAAGGGNDLIKITGVKSLDGLSLNGNIVKVKASSLNRSNVTISGDYKLALDGEVDKPTTTKAWTFNKKDLVASYNQTTTAGYTLAKNAKSISYSSKSTKNLIKVNGVKSASGFTIKNKVVTVPKAAFNKKTVTVSDGYTLKLGKGTETPKTAAADWVHSGTTAIYKSSSTSAGYSTSSDNKSITYSPAIASSTLATITGVKANANPALKGNVFTLTKDNLSSNKVSVNGKGYEFNFAKGNYAKTEIKGNKYDDQITNRGSNLSIVVGAGNDTVKALGSKTTVTGGKGNDFLVSNKTGGNVFVYANGDGNDVISNFAANDKISIKSGTADVKSVGKDVIFTIGKGKITIKGGVGKTINYVDKNGENTYPEARIITLTEGYGKKTYTMNKEIRTLDASAVQRDLEITGNEFINKLIGGAGNDTLIGGKSNDTLKGGDGSDVFVYANGDGNDVITDYTEDDMIRFTKGTAKVTSSDKDVIFTVGTGKLTVKNAKSKVVTYIDAKGKTNYYPAPKNSVIVNGGTVKILEEYASETFNVGNVKDGSKVEMIDAALVSRDLKIVGNAQANVILGGFGDDTIIGGKNNDTLQGGDGKNVFVYANGDGNDVIVDYNTGDKISLVSGAVISSSVKGDDVVLKVGKNKITLNNGVDKVITAIDKDGNNRIIGGTKDDKIKGDKGADTLQGGKGNDSLWGNDGADTFIYSNGDGKDIIYGFDNTDMLQIMDVEAKNITGTVNTKGTEIYFKVGKTSSAITLKDFGKTTSFNVNGDSYKISNKKLVPSS